MKDALQYDPLSSEAPKMSINNQQKLQKVAKIMLAQKLNNALTARKR